MLVSIQTPEIYLGIIRVISLLVPPQWRLDWRREWEAEIFSRWLLLRKWEKLDAHSKLDLLKRVLGSVFDVLCFQPRPVSLVLVALNMLVASLISFGALQQLILDGVGGHKLQPILLSLVAIVVSILFITSGIAILRSWPSMRRLIISTGMLSILTHVYGVLPPHRNMGFFILIIGAGYGLAMMLAFEWNERRNLVS